MKKVIIFSLLLLCLLVAPCSAWQFSFEGHPDDLDPDENINQGTANPDYAFPVGAYGNHMLRCAIGITTGTKSFYINEEFGDYLEFTSGTVNVIQYPGTQYIGLKLYDAANNVVFQDTNMASYATPQYATTYAHINFKINDPGTGIDCYVNGVLKDSTAWTISQHATITKIEILYSNVNNIWDGYAYFDDFRSEPSLISCDPSASWTDSNQYFRVSHPTYLFTTWNVKAISPSGEILQTYSNVGAISEFALSTALLNFSGSYDLNLYAYESQFGNTYLYDTRSFQFSRPSTNFITCPDSATAGKSLKVSWEMNPYMSGCSLICDPPGTNNLDSYVVTFANGTHYFAIPSDTLSGTALIALKSPTGATLAYKIIDVVGVGAASSIELDKDTYLNTDKISIFYDALPLNTDILLQGSLNGVITIEQSWIKTGSGILSYQLPGDNLTYLSVIAANEGELLAEDHARVAYGEDYVLYGSVYDSFTQTPIEGAEVNLQGVIVYSDGAGRYSIPTSPGSKSLTVNTEGYNTHYETVALTQVTTLKNIYLVPLSESTGETGLIYGACSDYETGQSIETAYIQISNTTGVTFSALGRSSTGAYIFEDLPNGSTWTLKASKTGYDNYQQQITVNGSTFQLIRLVSQDYGGSTPSEDDDGDSTDSSTDDRPSRVAAKDSLTWLEETMPGLVKLAVLVFMLALVGWRF